MAIPFKKLQRHLKSVFYRTAERFCHSPGDDVMRESRVAVMDLRKGRHFVE